LAAPAKNSIRCGAAASSDGEKDALAATLSEPAGIATK
jgi:hypothetical protein